MKKINWLTAASLVVSNMIGTGVFTSLGFQLFASQNTWSILLLWSLGGVLALIGAFTFAELGTHYGQTGGDYVFISRGFHPMLGYLSAWTSLIVGFAAPVAIAAIAMETYLLPFGIPLLRFWTVLMVIGLSFFHTFNLQRSAKLQNFTTIFKLAFIAFLLGLGIFAATNQSNGFDFSSRNLSNEIFQPSFAVSLMYVTYAYTGWNAAAYIVGEIDEPNKNLPKALLIGTAIVAVAYVGLQLVFLKFAPVEVLQGKADVALVAIKTSFGEFPARWISAGIAFQLVATMSSYIWIGPRVVHTMAKDHRLWKPLSHQNEAGVPNRAVWLQCGITLLLIFSGSLQQVTLYTSFLLQLMGTVAVASLLATKRKQSDFKSPFRPWLQYFYVIVSLGFLVFIGIDKPKESVVGLLTIVVGAGTYWWSERKV